MRCAFPTDVNDAGDVVREPSPAPASVFPRLPSPMGAEGAHAGGHVDHHIIRPKLGEEGSAPWRSMISQVSVPVLSIDDR